MVFVLRKKNSQISFLHVYHHSSMIVLWWLTVRHCGGGSGRYSGYFYNEAVHVLIIFTLSVAARNAVVVVF